MGDDERKETRVQAALRQDAAPAADWRRIFEEHHARVIQAAYRVTGNASDAEDVLQNVFLRLLRRGEAPIEADRLGSYLHRSAVNAAIDLLRNRKGGRDIPLEALEGRLPADSAPGPEERRQARELRDWLREAVTRLSPQAGEIFTLRYLEDYSNQEIAELVGTSPGVVAVVLHRCRNRLRDEIRSLIGEPS